MSGGIAFPSIPAIGIVKRTDGAEVLKITALVGSGQVGDYFGNNGQMTPNEMEAAPINDTRVKVSSVLTTAANGVYTGALGAANTFTTEPVVKIVPKMNADNFDWRYDLSGSMASGYSITVTFTRRNNTVLGNLTTLLAGISLINTPVAVTFSLEASDRL